MKLNRIKNTKKNLMAGAMQKLICMCFPFIFRMVMIRKMGVEYLGLSSLFTSILNVLNLAEFGAENAIVYAMYEPIASDDKKTICAIMGFTKKCYRIVGIATFLIGLIITPFVPKLITGGVPDNLNIYLLFIISVSAVSLRYFVEAYKEIVLIAYQRNDMRSWNNTVRVAGRYSLQIAVIMLWQNYYVFLLVEPLMEVVSNILISVFVDKLYPELKACGTLPEKTYREFLQNVKNMFFYKVGYIFSVSVDSIVISAMLGLAVLTKYDNYHYIITVLWGMLSIYYDSIRAGIGNKLALEGKPGGWVLFKQLSAIQGWIIGWMSICLVCMYQDFMLFWIGDASLLLNNSMVVLLGAYMYSRTITEVIQLYKESAGLWRYDRFCPIATALCNLILNIILVKRIGLYGIVISTIVCSLGFSLLWSCRGFFKNFFEKGYREYLWGVAKNTVFTLIVGALTYYVCSFVSADSSILRFLIKGVICAVLPNILFFAWLRKNPAVKSTLLSLKAVKSL